MYQKDFYIFWLEKFRDTVLSGCHFPKFLCRLICHLRPTYPYHFFYRFENFPCKRNYHYRIEIQKDYRWGVIFKFKNRIIFCRGTAETRLNLHDQWHKLQTINWWQLIRTIQKNDHQYILHVSRHRLNCVINDLLNMSTYEKWCYDGVNGNILFPANWKSYLCGWCFLLIYSQSVETLLRHGKGKTAGNWILPNAPS